MSAADSFVLQFVFVPTIDGDMRTFKVHLLSDGSPHTTELYRFHHPVTGLSHGLTTFHRQNLTTHIFETAGQIEWSSDYNATVHFGLEEVHIRDLRKAKKSSSRSRRFKAAGSEYKWKMASDSVDLFCVDSRGKVIASWNQEQSNLLVSPKGESILDRLVVTCFLNLWALRHLGQW
ncbi:hypothetical protein EV368DRAFT_73710 [Lentinula lateritia]|uniref:Uncharacterized protein n=1 Tax=Lentinula aff. lateritia TaxID=2804960 RepID=A0ACC1U424_9AGAR|nr:hypothetical protein F5876DRAFT_88111 [Lentinula aff. lateritia]KAJ3853016.1 hypothetical protein EV368DRAFT_73710 [Lentinula lateritia]